MRLVRTILLLAATALAGGTVAWARSAAGADESVKWVGIAGGVKPVAGQAFSLGLSLVNGGPDRGHVRINVQAPEGVRRLGGSLDCTQNGQLFHCDELDTPVGDNGSGTISFVASAAGTYTFGVSLDRLSTMDPDPSNNSDSIAVTVAPRPVRVGAVLVRPIHPRAGSPFVVSLDVEGAAVTSGRCAVSVGKAAARVAGARVTCSVRTRASSRGRLLRGTIAATAGGRSVTRSFSVRLR
jgi:hypothetical protein